MAVNVFQDLVERTTINETAKGRTGSRTFALVVDQGDNIDGAGAEKVVNSIQNYNAAGVPRIGDAFPGDGDLLCHALQPVGLSPRVMMIEAQYRTWTPDDAAADSYVSFSADAGLRSIQTIYDNSENLITVTNPITGETQAVEVAMDVPTFRFSVTRRYSILPTATILDNTGRINSTGFFVDPAGYSFPNHTTRMNGARIQKYDGDGWVVTFEFESLPEGAGNAPNISGFSSFKVWSVIVAAQDESTGRAVSDTPLVPGVSIEQYDIYEERDFSFLNLFQGWQPGR